MEDYKKKTVNEKNRRRKSRSRSRSRSRSYSKDKERRETRDKRSKEASKSKKRKDYKNKDRSRSESPQYVKENFDSKLEKLRRNTFVNKKERKSDFPSQKEILIKLPNKGILANVIQNNVVNNRRLDFEEVERASENLKRVDLTTERKVNIIQFNDN